MQFRGAWDRNNPWLLRKQPRERDLSRRRLLSFCDLAEQINQSLIGFASLRRKAREYVAEIRTVERSVFVNLSREKAPAQRTVRNKTDSEFLKCGQHFFFRISEPKRVFVLECGERLDCMCATNRLHSSFREAEVLHLTCSNQFLHRTGDIFNRHAGIDAVLIEQIDNIGPQSLQRSVGDLFDVLWPTIQAELLTFGTKFESELRGNCDSLTQRSQRFANELFVRERTVNFSGIEKRNPAFNCRPNQRDHLILVFGRTVAKAHSHTAQSDSRHFQIALSKFPLLHCFLPSGYALITPI